MKKQPSQIKIFFSLIMGTLYGHVNRLFPKKVELPYEIGKYKFEKKLKYNSNWNNYQIAIYKDKNGKKYFAKQWSGRFKDYEYLMLKNEENVLKELNKLKSPIPRIKIPQIYGSYKNKFSYIVFFEFIDINKKSLQKNTNLKNLYVALEHIQMTGSKIKDNKVIQNRTAEFIVATYFLSIIIILLSRPRLFPTAAKHIPFYLRHIKTLLNQKNLVLTHRDIHIDNLILNEKNTYITDFGSCVKTLQHSDEIMLLIQAWNNKDAKRLFEKRFLEILKSKNHEDCILFSILAITILTNLLSEKKHDKKRNNNHLQIFSFITVLMNRSNIKLDKSSHALIWLFEYKINEANIF